MLAVFGSRYTLPNQLKTHLQQNQLNAWFSPKGAEDADMCAWTFGSSQARLPSGAYYNMTLNGISTPTRNYLIQRELDINSKCYVDYVTKQQ
jgi:hypothetical protein